MDEISKLVLERIGVYKVAYAEISGPGIFSGFVYMNKSNLRKMYGGEIPKTIHLLIEGNGE